MKHLKHNDNWEAIYAAMRQHREELAREKKASEAQALAPQEQVSPSETRSQVPAKRGRKRSVSYHDDSKAKWELRNSAFKGGFDRE